MKRFYKMFLVLFLFLCPIVFTTSVQAKTKKGDYVEPAGKGFDYMDYSSPHSVTYKASPDGEEVKLLDERSKKEIRKMISDAISSKVAKNEQFLGLIHETEEKGLLHTEKNHHELYTVENISQQGNRSDYIYIVDENALVYVIKDTYGNGIPNAMVSLSYLDDDQNVIRRHITTSDGNVKGIAAFDDMEGMRYGVLDITAEGYHGVTLLEDEMTGGETRTIILEEEKPEETIYVRAVDLDGRDLVNNDTILSLIENDSHKMRFSILLTRKEGVEIPTEVELRSKKDGRLIYTFRNPSSYDENSDTFVYQGEETWIRKEGLLKEADQLFLTYAGMEFPLKNVIVENAIASPSFEENKKMDMKGESVVPKFKDANVFTNAFTIGMSELSINVSTGVTPDGVFYIMCSKTFDSVSDNWSTLFEKTYSPKVKEKTGTIMERIEKSVEKSVDTAIKKGDKIEGKETTFLVDPNYGSFTAGVSVMIRGSYNKDSKQYLGSATFGFNFNLIVGKQVYTMISFVPVSFGAELGFAYNIKITPAICADTIFPPSGVSFDWYRTKPNEVHITPSFKAYICAGIRNALGVDVTGSAAFDIGMVYHAKNKEDVKLPEPHTFIDFSANLSMNIYMLLMTKTINLWDITKSRLADNWEDYTKVPASLLSDTPFKPLDLSIGEESLVNHLSQYNEKKGKLESYTMDVPKMNASSELSLLAEDTFIDNQIQLVSTKDATALFRIISKDQSTRLVYQLQDSETGEFEDILYEIPMPEGSNVYEYAVTSQKIEMYKVPSGYVYIAAVTGDVESDDIDERSHSTSVVGLVVDINEGKLIRSKVVAEPREDAFYFAPIPAHSRDDLAIAYKEAKSYDTCDEFKNYLVGLDGSLVLMSENVPVYTDNYCDSLWNATFWTVDAKGSDQNTLKLIAYNCNGSQRAYQESDQDPEHIWNNFRLSFDISEFHEKYPDVNPVACMGSLHGTEYMIVAGKIYQLNCGKESKTPIESKEVPNARLSNSTFDGLSGHYQMLTDHDLGTLFITSMKSVYETDVETTSSKLIGNELELSYIVEETNTYDTFITLHGSRRYFLKDINAYKYTCGYNKHKMGIELAIDSFHDEKENSNDIYVWEENAGYGFELTDFYVENHLVSNKDNYLGAYITFQNAGYGKADIAVVQVKDSSGKILNQAKYHSNDGTYEDLGEIVAYPYEVLYPADQVTMPIWFKTNPDWSTNTEEEITVSLLNKNEEVISEMQFGLDHPLLVFSGKQEVWHGKHYARFLLENESVIAGERPQIVFIGNYTEDKKNDPVDPENIWNNSRILGFFSAGSGTLLSDWDDSIVKYNVTYPMEEIWENNKDADLLEVKAYMVDQEGKLLSDGVVTIPNPYYGVEEWKDDSNPEEESTAEEGSTTEEDSTAEEGSTTEEGTTEEKIDTLSKPEILKLKALGGKKVKVKWSKNREASGYEIAYSTSPGFRRAKIINVVSRNTSSFIIRRLVAGKKYYLRVRCYKAVQGKKCFSAWSVRKTVKVKK